MAYLDPLAYLLGIEGAALLRAYAGEYDRDFVAARIAEIRRLLDDPGLKGQGVETVQVDTTAGYQVWSKTYDDPGNGLFSVDAPLVHEILADVPAGDALDAACGTGRFAEYLAAKGHRVVGVDSSPDMLARARQRVPEGTFIEGDLHGLPLADDGVDVITCALALTHVPDLRPVVAEFARVLRPGGHLVIADVHRSLVGLGSVPKMPGRGGEKQILPAYPHHASEYLQAALPLGFQVRRCEEPRSLRADLTRESPAETTIGPWFTWPWTLLDNVPTAAAAAFADTPSLIVWHFELT
jgi:ubiquinone/menaquinone biosynthesis C-methylase UbiE